jgi:TolA-binding protein
MEQKLGKSEKSLQAQVGQLQERDSNVQQSLDQMMAAQYQAMQPQQQQQPTQNVFQKAQSMGSRPTRGLGGALSAPTASGTPVRGSLAGSLGSMSPGGSK